MRNEALQTETDAVNVFYAVTIKKFQDDGSNDVVDPGAQAPAGDDGASEFARVELDFAPGPRYLEGRRHFPFLKRITDGLIIDIDKHAFIIGHVAHGRRIVGLSFDGRRDFGFPKNGDLGVDCLGFHISPFGSLWTGEM